MSANDGSVLECAVNALGLAITFDDPFKGSIDLCGIEVVFAIADGTLFLKASLGEPPQEYAESFQFWKLLLMANNRSCDLAGSSIGYDEDSSLITFQWSWPLSDLCAARLENALLNYGEALEKAAVLIQEGPFPDDVSSQKDYSLMMQV